MGLHKGGARQKLIIAITSTVRVRVGVRVRVEMMRRTCHLMAFRAPPLACPLIVCCDPSAVFPRHMDMQATTPCCSWLAKLAFMRRRAVHFT